MLIILTPAGTYHVKLPVALTNGILACLEDIFIHHSYADKAVSGMLMSHRQWGSRDRKIATKVIYQCVRHYLKYEEWIKVNWQEATDDSKIILTKRLLITMLEDEGLHQYLLSDTSALIQPDFKDIFIQKPWLLYGHQKWIYEKIVEDWKEIANDVILVLDTPALVYIRRNTLKGSVNSFEKDLTKNGIAFQRSSALKNAYIIDGPNQLRNSQLFKEGGFEFQDIGSQMIAEACQVIPGMTVLDYCAGKGGKTLSLAANLVNKGQVIASDIDYTRLQHLKKRADISGVVNLYLYTSEALKDMDMKADVVLVDAPCSGSGTFRRQPDLKYRLTKQHLEEVVRIQRDILLKAGEMVKEGGYLIYATCSVFKEENDHQIAWLINTTGNNYKLEKEMYILPQIHNSDGFYYAVLKKV